MNNLIYQEWWDLQDSDLTHENNVVILLELLPGVGPSSRLKITYPVRHARDLMYTHTIHWVINDAIEPDEIHINLLETAIFDQITTLQPKLKSAECFFLAESKGLRPGVYFLSYSN